MGAAPSHVASHSFSDGTAITVVTSWLGELTAESEPREDRTLILSYEVRDRDNPEYIYDSDHDAFQLRRAGSSTELQGLDEVVAWLDDREWSEEGDGDYPIDFLDVFLSMIVDAVDKSWSRTTSILVMVVIDVEVELVEEPGLEPASEAAVAALERVVVVDVDTTSCAICLEEFSLEGGALSMPCSHAFHEDCLGEWLKKRSTCPMCRFQLLVDLSVSD